MENKYIANYEFKEQINIEFDEWDCNRDFLGSFRVDSINIANQEIVKWGKGEFTLSGIWDKNRHNFGMKGQINIRANCEDVKKLGDKIQNGTLTWNDINNLEFRSWHVDSEEDY